MLETHCAFRDGGNDFFKLLFRLTSNQYLLGYGMDGRGVEVPFLAGERVFFSPERPDQFCGPPNLVYNEYRGIFPRG
jgi:hypothetical protein